MRASYETIIHRISQEGEWYIAQCLQVDVASQGVTEDEALENLRGALELHFTPAVATITPRVRDISRHQSRMKPLPFGEVKRKLEAAADWHSPDVRQDDGRRYSHRHCAKHNEVAPGTLRSILRQAGISADEFDAL